MLDGGGGIQSVIDKTVHFMIHPKIMTDQKQSGTKKPLLTHYRQQLMAHEQPHRLWPGHRMQELGLGMSQSASPRLSLVTQMFSWLLIGWLSRHSGPWCWTGSGNVLQGQPVQLGLMPAPNVGHNSDILSGWYPVHEFIIQPIRGPCQLNWPIRGRVRSRILSMVAEIWDMEPFVRTDNTHGKPQWAAVPSFFSLLSLVSISIGNNLIMSRHFVVNYIPVTGQHFAAHILIFKIFGF